MWIMTVSRNSSRAPRQVYRPISGVMLDGRWSAPMAHSGTLLAFSKGNATNLCEPRSTLLAELGYTALQPELLVLAPVRFRFIAGTRTTGNLPKSFRCRARAGIVKASLRP